MKTFFTLGLSVFLFVFSANASVAHHVGVANYQFSPNAFNAEVGDTVIWTMNGGTGHTTTSISIPAGASGWDNTFTAVGQSFAYVITIPGTYNYHCDFHYTLGMTGSFTVTGGTNGIITLPSVPKMVLPNPFTGTLMINYDKPSTLLIFNLLGDKIIDMPMQNPQGTAQLNFSSLLPGLYIASLVSEGNIVETRKFIKQ